MARSRGGVWMRAAEVSTKAPCLRVTFSGQGTSARVADAAAVSGGAATA
jgi:hypothetical protein